MANRKQVFNWAKAEKKISELLSIDPEYFKSYLKIDFQKGQVFRRKKNSNGWERTSNVLKGTPVKKDPRTRYRYNYFTTEEYTFMVYEHRLVFFFDNFEKTGCLTWPEHIHHKDLPKHNNSIENLEASDQRDNLEKWSDEQPSSLHPGVTRNKKTNGWRVRRRKFNVLFHCGSYQDTPEGRALACRVSDELAAYLDSFKDKQSLPPFKQVREEVFKRLGLTYKHGSPYQTGKPTP